MVTRCNFYFDRIKGQAALFSLGEDKFLRSKMSQYLPERCFHYVIKRLTSIKFYYDIFTIFTGDIDIIELVSYN